MKLNAFPFLLLLTFVKPQTAYCDQRVGIHLGEAQFFNGDYIKIESVTSSGEGFERGATFTVTGTYTLNTADSADLCFYTTRHPEPGEDPAEFPEKKTQRLKAKRGEHPFTLSKVAAGSGGPHLTFYGLTSRSAFGGVYFGDASNVWMKKGWSYDAPPSVMSVGSEIAPDPKTGDDDQGSKVDPAVDTGMIADELERNDHANPKR